ncbi:SagB family peptide dehydrogenase [Tumebacillus sp. ITR2]|uniref:SagB family peptide dehydrogenase n=1 Tax=Tumebacillus amylolyticus TaxID=2801339 RepID=A0ABS1JDM3_9BACL|nr:SagB family peptide dehydrogenase [Tumebacillus amylolyticus]MBL0388397.1 SagB family peptide dehydrogenase [Tumebacillus amylolyticus]
MNPDAFLHALHYDVDRIRPSDWQVDWDDSPLLYKLYRGLPQFPLSAEVPLTLPGKKASGTPSLREVGHFLWYVNGLMQASDSGYGMKFRRFFPSGGGLYPSELYVYLKTDGVPTGVYHYSAAHHRLVLLREGKFDEVLGRALGGRCDLDACWGAVFVSTMFWKNFFKYNNFAYRLQGLDAGVLLGQLLEVSKRFGYTAGVCYQFLDRAVNSLLGISELEESVYAVVPLSVKPTGEWFAKAQTNTSCKDLIRELPDLHLKHYVRSKWIKPFPLLVRMNEEAMLDNTNAFTKWQGGTSTGDASNLTALPQVPRLSYDLAAVGRKRTSSGEDFVLHGVSQTQLAMLLQEATNSFSYCNDLDGGESTKPRVSLYGSLTGVEGLPDGAYSYDNSSHTLQSIRLGDHRYVFQQGVSMQNVNMTQAPLCFHVVGDRDHLTESLGFRGYRIQQMEAGLLVHRLVLAATALELSGHPLLDFDTAACDEHYNLQTQATLIQIPIGVTRVRPRFQGLLHR